jgi:nucleotide-binding universal stress UspA family protein
MSERILVPLDGSAVGESALRRVIKLIAEFKPREIPQVILLRVVKPEVRRLSVGGGLVEMEDSEEKLQIEKKEAFEYLEKKAVELRELGVDVSLEVMVAFDRASSADSIIEAEKKFNADVVAMSTHGRRGIKRWAFGSVTEKVLRGGSLPVMLVRATEK